MNKASKKNQPMHQQVDDVDISGMQEAISKKVLKKLGKPPNFFKIDVHHLWSNKWRVNVWCIGRGTGEGLGVVPTFSIDDSFFVEISKDNRMSSTPRIVKKY